MNGGSENGSPGQPGRPDPREKPVVRADSSEVSSDHAELMRLAAAAAHQIKSPLSSVQTIIATLMGGFVGPLEPRQRWLLEKAWERCGHGVKLVKELMRLRQLEQLTDESFGPVNLLSAYVSSTDEVRERAQEKEIEFESVSEIQDASQAWIRGEAELVRQVLAVLLDNAIKYTPAGGAVSARLYRESPEGDAPRLCMEVVDTGIGIPPEGYEKLFKEFYRAPSARRLSTEGTGLGLAFAHRAAARLDGSVRLEPSPEGGVRALASFPFDAECARLGSSGRTDGAARASRDLTREADVSQRVVVVGGVAAGSKAAAKIMRLDPRADVTIVEKGKFLAYSGCGMPFYISGAVHDQRTLLETPLGKRRDSSFFHDLKNVRALDLTEATVIDRERKIVTIRHLIEQTERELPYDKLVLATGTRPVIPDLPGVDLDGIYTLHGIADAEAIRGRLASSRVKDVVIVGGGLLGCQITDAVASRGARVTLVEARPTVLGIVDRDIALLVERHLELHGVRVLCGTQVTGFSGEGQVREVHLGEDRSLAADFVLLATGIEPEIGLAREAELEIGSTGAIKVDALLRTSDPAIFAVGDCAEQTHRVTGKATWTPGAAAASIQGRKAAINICGGSETYPGIVGSLIIKLFDAAAGRTGLTERRARKDGYRPISAIVPGPDRAHFAPGAKPIILKLVADGETGRLLGAQAFGLGEISKRIDIVATALSAKMRLDQLADLNLAYSPSFSMAMDNVITAANVLENKMKGHIEGISPLDLREEMVAADPPTLIDVRLPSEYGVTRLRGSRHIPLGTLRSRLEDLPKDENIVLVCSIGLRSYEASLILRSHGFERVRMLDGGLEAWPFSVERLT